MQTQRMKQGKDKKIRKQTMQKNKENMGAKELFHRDTKRDISAKIGTGKGEMVRLEEVRKEVSKNHRRTMRKKKTKDVIQITMMV